MNFEDFFPNVMPEVPGCPDILARQKILFAAIEFCRHTKAWIEQLAPITLVDGTSDYVMTPPVQGYVMTPISVVFNGARKLTPITPDQLYLVLPNWMTQTGNEPAYFNAASVRGSISVYPIPSGMTGQTIVVRAACIPDKSATSLPDFLGTEYLDTIASGAKSMLMAMAGMQWSNPALSTYHKAMFDAAVTNARIAEEHARVTGSLRVTPRAFGAV